MRYRRAEGIWMTLAPCRPDELHVIARRQDDDIHSTLTRDELRVLSRLDDWRTADELGVAEQVLTSLVERRLAFWSHAHPERTLTARPTGGNALADNVYARPLLGGDRAPWTFPVMPRLGSLDHAKLAGVRLEVFEWETSIATVDVMCCSRHAHEMRDLIARPEPGELLSLLDDAGLLGFHTPPPWDGAPRVTWLAHAGVLIESAGQRILIDPDAWPRSRPSRHAVRPYDLRDLGDVDAVLITHGDPDHLSPAALLRLPRTTPIVIPRADAPRPYHVDMKRVLALLGFTNVIEVDRWQELSFGDVTVTAAPFRGEDWGLELPTRTYLVRSPALTVYASTDALTDDDVIARLAGTSIDLALVGVTGNAESHAMPPGFGYGHFYADHIARERHDEWIELCNGPRDAAAVADRLGARFAFGYAAGGAPFCNIAYSDRGTHAEMATHLTRARPLELAVGVPTSLPRDQMP